MNYVTTNLRIPEDVIRELKLKAVHEKKSVSQLIREAIQQFLLAPEEPVDHKRDPFNRLIGMAQSGNADGSVRHDHYLYGKKG